MNPPRVYMCSPFFKKINFLKPNNKETKKKKPHQPFKSGQIIQTYLQRRHSNGWWSHEKVVNAGTSLVVQWLGIHLPKPGTWIQSLVQEDPMCLRAAKPTTTEPALYSPYATTKGAPALRGLCSTTREAAPVRTPCTARKSSPCLLQLEKAVWHNKDPAQPKISK